MLWKLKTLDLNVSYSSVDTFVSSVSWCVMKFCVSLWWHLSSPFSSCFCTPVQNDLLCHIWCSPCCRLDIFLVHVGYHNIYTYFGVFLVSFLPFVMALLYGINFVCIKFYVFLGALSIAFCALFTSTPYAQHIICSLILLSFSFQSPLLNLRHPIHSSPQYFHSVSLPLCNIVVKVLSHYVVA